MFRHFSLALLTTTTFLTPLHGSLAQQAETAECSIMTIVSDSGEISWNTDEAAGELIAIAKEIKLTPEQAHEACHGEVLTEQAKTDEIIEEEKVKDTVDSKEVIENAVEKSVMSSNDVLLPMAGGGLAAALGSGGGGGIFSSAT